MYKNHRCLVFEHLDVNLYTKMRRCRNRPFSLNEIRSFTLQILQALDYMRDPRIRIVHCDIKPENILLTELNKASLKLADFGSSCLYSIY